MRQATQKENAERRRKNFILSIIITIIVVYAAVPTYGIIRDISTGEHVFVLSSNLPDVDFKRPVVGFVGKVYHFFFPQQGITVPVLRRIDLKGRVVYTDKTPYPNGIIELRSDPRHTRTDSQGYFMFIDVGEGAHTISVLDEAGNVLAKCAVDIKRTIEVKDAVLVRLPDGTFVFQVAVDIKVLEITLFLQKGDDENITGIDGIVLGVVPEGAPQTANPTNQNDQINLTNPANPTSPSVPSGGGGSGGGGGGDSDNPPPPPPYPFDFDVLDTATTTSYSTGGAASVNIFGANKRIAPGMSGSYRFTVDNTGNRYSTFYDVTFTATDTLPAASKIPMRFRLKADGVYVAGDAATWCTLDQLYQNTIAAGGRDVEYTLEWNWREGANDNDFAAYADNAAFSYGLTIKVRARAQ